LFKKGINALQGVINYFILFLYLIKNKTDVVHFQWLPYLEICDLEYYLLKLFHRCFPNTRYILTTHNIYPHNSSIESKAKYRKRFCKVEPLINTFITHTRSSKQDLNKEFNVQYNKIQVAHHGVFVPQDYIPTKRAIVENNIWHLIMYGKHSYYKGTDILVKALSLLDSDLKKRIHVTICGTITKEYLHELQSVKTDVEIDYIIGFIADDKLYSLIDKSDIILLPYRAISQSGVLLLALYFRKMIISSDLPSFKETLEGFTDDMFAKAEDAQSLADLITRYLRGEIDIGKQLQIIDDLNQKYSWQEVAKKTIEIYSST